MKGDFEKCEAGDFLIYKTDDPSFSWQNDVYMILGKKEDGWVDDTRMCDTFMERINEGLSVSCVNIESECCTLVKRSEIEGRYSEWRDL